MIPLANAGFPLFIPVFEGIAVAALPLMALEMLIARRVIGESWRVCFFTVFGANLISTLAGIPLTTIVVFIGGHLLVAVGQNLVPSEIQGPGLAALFLPVWLPPVEGTWQPWHGRLSVSVLLVAFFFASVWIEARMARKILPVEAAPRARRWAWIANGWSYGIMLVLEIAGVFANSS